MWKKGKLSTFIKAVKWGKVIYTPGYTQYPHVFGQNPVREHSFSEEQKFWVCLPKMSKKVKKIKISVDRFNVKKIEKISEIVAKQRKIMYNDYTITETHIRQEK